MAKLKLLDDTWLRPNVEYMEAKRNILRNKRMGRYSTQQEYVEARNRLTARWMRNVYTW